MAEQLGLLRRARAWRGWPTAARALRWPRGRAELRGGQPVWFIGRPLRDDSARAKYPQVTRRTADPGIRASSWATRGLPDRGRLRLATGASFWGLAAFSPSGTDIPGDRVGMVGVHASSSASSMPTVADERQRIDGAALGERWRPINLDGLDLNDLGRAADGRRLFFEFVAQARRESGLPESREEDRPDDEAPGIATMPRCTSHESGSAGAPSAGGPLRTGVSKRRHPNPFRLDREPARREASARSAARRRS